MEVRLRSWWDRDRCRPAGPGAIAEHDGTTLATDLGPRGTTCGFRSGRPPVSAQNGHPSPSPPGAALVPCPNGSGPAGRSEIGGRRKPKRAADWVRSRYRQRGRSWLYRGRCASPGRCLTGGTRSDSMATWSGAKCWPGTAEVAVGQRRLATAGLPRRCCRTRSPSMSGWGQKRTLGSHNSSVLPDHRYGRFDYSSSIHQQACPVRSFIPWPCLLFPHSNTHPLHHRLTPP